MPEPTSPAPDGGFVFILAIVALAAIVAMTLWT